MSAPSVDKIEAVARALCAAKGQNPDEIRLFVFSRVVGYGAGISPAVKPECFSRPSWYTFESEARAAIAAMREPTEAMLEAGGEAWIAYTGDDHEYEIVWRAMIDFALSPQPVASAK